MRATTQRRGEARRAGGDDDDDDGHAPAAAEIFRVVLALTRACMLFVRARSQPDMILTGSRDKKILVWNLTRDDPTSYGVPRRSLSGYARRLCVRECFFFLSCF